jgi:tyrosyl-tRNA synthetase
MNSAVALLEELRWRGLLHQQTEGLPDALAKGPIGAYAGFDPTAPSLHVGNLIPVMGLVHLQRAGNSPVVLVGGGTGMIGDPSGKTSERQLSSPEVVSANTNSIGKQLERFLDFSGSSAARMVDNADWLLSLRAVDFMRDVGKHFTLSYMLAKDSVASRLQAGISYTEFSYMLLQAYDYLELFRRYGVSLQIGGSDQWGNITAGIELIRRSDGGSAHGLTFPLLTTATGNKFGKTEAGSVWLDPARTSPYHFFQFWINSDDADAARYLRLFTLLSHEEIAALEREIAERPSERAAQKLLAATVTAAVHGDEAAKTAAEMSGVLFGGNARALSETTLIALRSEVPYLELGAGQLGMAVAGDGDAVAEMLPLLVASGIAASKGAARRLLDQGGVYVNGERASADQRYVQRSELLAGEYLLLRRGAREYVLVRILGRDLLRGAD